jgi:site-specific DNA-methyltransferase (adenine-specific)
MRAEYTRDGVKIFKGDSLNLYEKWEPPVVIISDGPYGLGSFIGDPPTPFQLDQWYEPHLAQWSRFSTPLTTLWFWNSEIGWATVHPVLLKYGWEYRNCHVWDKGIAHVAGNSNGQTLRKFPVVTEVCVQYVKRAAFNVNGHTLSMQEWLRHEWERTGLPLYKTNEACGVDNAATRKYFTKDHLWYYPPPEAFEKLVHYANKQGDKKGRPYFSIDGKNPLTKQQWTNMRSKFNFENSITNVWHEPAVRGIERLKKDYKCVHTNQKPLKLINLCIKASSDKGDVVWEPFGGLCSAAIASHKLGRRCYAAEVNDDFYKIAVERLAHYDVILELFE